MYSHVMIGSNNIEKSKQFYDNALGALGSEPAMVDENNRLIYMNNDGLFLVTTPIDGQPASHANGGTIGFAAKSEDEVKAWHAAGCANGGTTCEDPPGIRESAFGPLYLAYMRDPDGNKVCAMYRAG